MRKKGPKTKQKSWKWTFKGNKGQNLRKNVELIFWEKNFVKTCREREQKTSSGVTLVTLVKMRRVAKLSHSTNDQELLEPIKNE
jgi:hypothetical protein